MTSNDVNILESVSAEISAAAEKAAAAVVTVHGRRRFPSGGPALARLTPAIGRRGPVGTSVHRHV